MTTTHTRTAQQPDSPTTVLIAGQAYELILTTLGLPVRLLPVMADWRTLAKHWRPVRISPTPSAKSSG